MNNQDRICGEIRPRLTERACGGWLAVAPAEAAVHLGVTGQTENEARENFLRSFDRWKEILATDKAEANLGHSLPI